MTNTGYTLLTELNTFLVVDVETCHSDDGDHIIQIGIVKIVDGEIETATRNQFYTLVNPQVPIDKRTQKVHNITDEMVTDQPTFDQIVEDLDDWLTQPDCVLVAHKATFDVSRLKEEYARLNKTLPTLPLLDTLLLPDQLKHPMPSEARNLTAVASAFGYTSRTEEEHDALYDATLTAKVLTSLLLVAANTGITQLTDLLAKTGNSTTDAILTSVPKEPTYLPPPELSNRHLTTHGKLPKQLTEKRAKKWVEQVVECASLGCFHIRAKAELAAPHAPVLLKLLDTKAKLLLAVDGTGNVVAKLPKGKPNPIAERWQTNTFLLAWSIVVKHSLSSSPAATWWHKHRVAIRSLPPCQTDDELVVLCPSCRAGKPCMPDRFHQQVAFAAVQAVGVGSDIPAGRAKALSSVENSQLNEWVKKGSSDLAGFASFLLIAHFERDGNISSASNILDLARGLRLDYIEPRLALVSALDWQAKGNLVEPDVVVNAVLSHRNTDRRFAELEEWYLVVSEPAPEPRVLVRTQRWSSRPTSRTAKRRYKL